MISDKSLDLFLKEDNTNPTIPSPGNVLVGLNHEEQERMLRQINSMLVILTDSPALNPYYILERIKTRLKLVMGMTFEDTYFLGEVGSFERPLFAHNGTVSVYGGVVGFPNDNAWGKFFPAGLVLKVHFLKSRTLYNVVAEIVPVPDPIVPPSISEA
jgi:hypothetical protein